jgi:uncharacterized protein
MRRLAWCSLFLVSTALHAQARVSPPPTKARPAAPGTKSPAAAPNPKLVTIGTIDTLYSTGLKEKRPYWVYTPPSYGDTTYTPQRYPVLYLLDGDAHFHSVTGLLQILGTGVNGTYVVPEMIVVAIPNTDRMRDMSPTHVDKGLDGKPSPGMKSSGGMGNFLQFIKGELIPHIDSAYRTAPYRVFVGHSLGGITTIDALYTMPETFNAYIAIDPSLWWDNSTLLRQAKDRLSKPMPSKRALYVGQANTVQADDTIPNLHFNNISQFDRVMETYNQAGVRYAFKYYPDDDHGSVPLIAEYDALRFIFASYKGDLIRSLKNPEMLTAHFAKVSEELGYTVLPSERMLDFMGQIAPQIPGADQLKLFTMAAELYPQSAHAQLSLGQGYMAKGDKTQALAAYEKALSLDPKNSKAKELLEKAKAGK